jgi:hypothetical protein
MKIIQHAHLLGNEQASLSGRHNLCRQIMALAKKDANTADWSDGKVVVGVDISAHWSSS